MPKNKNFSNRKSVSKRTRFEVFKRDSFTCQYCGRKAPDVVLEIDHVAPVSSGGTNDPRNLITACRDCNLGKTNIPLDDYNDIPQGKNEVLYTLSYLEKWTSNYSADGAIEICNEGYAVTGEFVFEFLRSLCAEYRDFITLHNYAQRIFYNMRMRGKYEY